MQRTTNGAELRERMLAEQVMSIRAATAEDRAAHEALATMYRHRLRRASRQTATARACG